MKSGLKSRAQIFLRLAFLQPNLIRSILSAISRLSINQSGIYPEIRKRRMSLHGRKNFLSSEVFSLLIIPVIVLSGVVLFLGAGKPSMSAQSREDCSACHEAVVKAFGRTSHQNENCTACHQGAEKHLQEGTRESIFSFTPEQKSAAKSKVCLSCHHAEAGFFAASSHGRSGLDCTACHAVHSSPENRTNLAIKTCASCHEDILAEFNLNERHRLREGILTCTSCHDPHKPSSGQQLAGFKQQTCLQCHVEKGGPYLYEHGANQVEGCTACHVPHGSPNRHLLAQQSVADLCFSCHTQAPAWHSRFTSMTTNCTTCHVAIHGSNLNRLFLK